MIRWMAIALTLVSAALLEAAPAGAQYMFLDFDGDGAYTWVDGFGVHDTANVDLYIVTNRNSDGSAAACDADIFAYTVNLFAHADSVTFLSVTNRMPGMIALAPVAAYPYALSASYGGFSAFPPGKYRLMTFRAVFAGCPNLEIVPSSCFSPPGAVTSFGSSCGEGLENSMLPVEGLGSWGCTDIPLHTPTIFSPPTVSGTVGQPITFKVRVGAPDCYLFSFYPLRLPPGASLSSLGPISYGYGEATFLWIPGAGQAGTWQAEFEAYNPDPFNMRDLRATCATTITVSADNAPPAADAGGPYHGLQFVPVSFDASLSSDPDGDNLTYLWEYGDGVTGTGGAPLHTYTTAGVFPVVLHATDPGGLSDLDSTTATIARDLPVRLFTTSSNDPTKLGRGKPVTCFQVEAIDGAFTPDQIVSSSVFLRYTDPVCGELEIYTGGTKTATVSDTDKNGVKDYSACFSREGMQTLGMCMPKGTQTVTLELYGSLATGERIHGAVEHTFVSTGALQVAITPNPVNESSRIEFVTRRAGPVAVRVFDIRGRLVATLMEEPATQPGRHQVTFADLDRSAVRLASGIYFVRVRSQYDGEETRRITILK